MKVLLNLIRLVYTEKKIDFANALHESLLAYQVAPSQAVKAQPADLAFEQKLAYNKT